MFQKEKYPATKIETKNNFKLGLEELEDIKEEGTEERTTLQGSKGGGGNKKNNMEGG